MIDKSKTQIVGKWVEVDKKVVGDQKCVIIEHLVSSHLVKLAVRMGGWIRLYEDPMTNVLWELSYPENHLHGGGPPMLTELSVEEVNALYGELKK